MGLTPLDIQKKEFRRSFRGYDEGEVDAFLDLVVREFEKLMKDREALKEQLEALGAKMDQYQDMEDTLHNALVVAQQTAEEVRNSARKEADLVLEEARQRADRMLREAEERAREARASVRELLKRARMIQTQIRGMLTSQLELLASEARRLEILDQNWEISSETSSAEERQWEVTEAEGAAAAETRELSPTDDVAETS